jgi:glycine hydroxymethyltransferase
VIIGFSAYPRSYQFTNMCRIAHDHGCIVLADIAHINGLVAAGLHDTPFGTGPASADFVTMTTHKTFRGPRGAMVFSKNHIPEYIQHHFQNLPKNIQSLADLVDKTVFPGTSGGPHFNQMAAIGQSCLEILGLEKYPDGVDFKSYSQNTIDNTKALENGLKEAGLEIVSPSQNHLCLVKLPTELDSLEIQQRLERVGIICNRNGVPFDPKTPWRPSGLRFGMAALTSRGMTQQNSTELGKLIARVVLESGEGNFESEVKDLIDGLGWWY